MLEAPTVTDGPALWRLAADSRTLDVNSPYAYLLWCRDFALTSVVARANGEPVGFITGYRRPDETTTLLVWQVAVDGDHRGLGIAGRMLDHLTERQLQGQHPLTHLETSITPDNQASQRLFDAFAKRWGAAVDRGGLFDATLFPDGHLAEELYRIGPIDSRVPRVGS